MKAVRDLLLSEQVLSFGVIRVEPVTGIELQLGPGPWTPWAWFGLGEFCIGKEVSVGLALSLLRPKPDKLGSGSINFSLG